MATKSNKLFCVSTNHLKKLLDRTIGNLSITFFLPCVVKSYQCWILGLLIWQRRKGRKIGKTFKRCKGSIGCHLIKLIFEDETTKKRALKRKWLLLFQYMFPSSFYLLVSMKCRLKFVLIRWRKSSTQFLG